MEKQTKCGNDGDDNSCPDQANLLQDISPAGRFALAADFTQSETDYINALYLCDALMDNGNTQMLLDNIDLEWSDDALDAAQPIGRQIAQLVPNCFAPRRCVGNPARCQSDECARMTTMATKTARHWRRL